MEKNVTAAIPVERLEPD